MGKSKKKLKSERITAIRKQYDTFLEEDKKRRDRNEYILEKLDKIRSGSVLVQVRGTPKADVFTNYGQPVYDSKGYIERMLPIYNKSQNNFNPISTSNIVTTSLNERDVINEISKKYILIPRLTNTLVYDSNYPKSPNIDDNGEWKSKYRILDELKQNEKEAKKIDSVLGNEYPAGNNNGIESGYNEIEKANTDSQISKPIFPSSQFNEEISENLHDNTEIGTSSFKSFPQNRNKEIENPNPDVSDIIKNLDELNLNTKVGSFPQYTGFEKQLGNSIKASQENSSPKKNLDFSEELRNENFVYETDANITKLTEKEKTQAEYELQFKVEKENTVLEPFPQVEFANIHVENQMESHQEEQENSEAKLIYEDKNSPKSNEDLGNDDIKNVLNDSKTEVNFGSSEIDESSMINNPYYTDNTNLQDISKLEGEVIEQGSDINPHYEPLELPNTDFISPIDPIEQNQNEINPGQELENTVNETQIQEFEDEQNNMFYSEETPAEYTYDQLEGGNIASTEYGNNEAYVHGENYVYYEGEPQEKDYNSEINDQQESTEQYDPHYEEQYGNTEQQDQQEQQITSVEQYENEENVNQIQGYDQIHFEKPDDTVVDEVQQKLDAEQGYIESIDEEKDIGSIVNQAVMPEQKDLKDELSSPVN